MIVAEDQSGKEYKMDHYQVRFPTNVEDVARVLVDLTRKSYSRRWSSKVEEDIAGTVDMQRGMYTVYGVDRHA